jgi:hypothetical protein
VVVDGDGDGDDAGTAGIQAYGPTDLLAGVVARLTELFR